MVTHFQLPTYEFHWATRQVRDIAISVNSLGTWLFSNEQLRGSTQRLLEIISFAYLWWVQFHLADRYGTIILAKRISNPPALHLQVKCGTGGKWLAPTTWPDNVTGCLVTPMCSNIPNIIIPNASGLLFSWWKSKTDGYIILKIFVYTFSWRSEWDEV